MVGTKALCAVATVDRGSKSMAKIVIVTKDGGDKSTLPKTMAGEAKLGQRVSSPNATTVRTLAGKQPTLHNVTVTDDSGGIVTSDNITKTLSVVSGGGSQHSGKDVTPRVVSTSSGPTSTGGGNTIVLKIPSDRHIPSSSTKQSQHSHSPCDVESANATPTSPTENSHDDNCDASPSKRTRTDSSGGNVDLSVNARRTDKPLITVNVDIANKTSQQSIVPPAAAVASTALAGAYVRAVFLKPVTRPV